MLQSLLDIGFHRLPWPGIAGFFEGLEREPEYSLSGRAFLLNIRDRSCIPHFGLEGFSKSIPPKEREELGDRHTLRRGDLRRGNLEV